MNSPKALRKKICFCVISIVLFAVAAMALVSWLLPLFLPNLNVFVQMILFMLIFSLPLYFFISRQLEDCKSQVLEATRDSELAKTTLSREMDERQERYQVLVENSPAGIITCDLKGEILMVNPAVVKLLGSPSVAATKAVNVFNFPPLVESGIADSLKHCVETGQLFKGEAVYLRMHFVPLHDYNGKIAGGGFNQ
ncbi:MAG: PAS domain-containing protein [Eubacteriaceae bacterium]|jgi:PAS domain-containing protein